VTAAGARWVCCQLGAREHYAVPRALHRHGRLALLATDAWWNTESTFGPARLLQRYHTDLAKTPVRHFTGSLIAHEALWRVQRRDRWDLMIARNTWFQAKAAAALPDQAEPMIVFAHSYAADAVLREGLRRGWTTVLGQIDPGPRHYQLQDQLCAEHPEYGRPPVAPPARYFDGWRRECDAAHHIVVNSDWSRESLAAAGVDAAKMVTMPLPYEPESTMRSFERSYPDQFSAERPLRVLFVGSASVIKGAAALLEAVTALDDSRVELSMVGECAMTIPARIARQRGIRWIGPVDRLKVMEYYRGSDVLLFPSQSDGFGMAQVEARGWGLPIIASRHCGQVVKDGETGIVLDTVSCDSIAAALQRGLQSPALLAGFSRRMQQCPAPGLDALATGLIALEGE
jgi:glycosyltransferase involved in cell wall biosynthesis